MPTELPPFLKPNAQGCQLTIKAQPGAKRTALAGLHGEALKIALQAQPTDGKANEALLKFLAEVFSRPQQTFTLVRGEKSRHKVVDCQGLTPEQALFALGDGLGRKISSGNPST